MKIECEFYIYEYNKYSLYQLKIMVQIVSWIRALHQIVIWCPPLNQSSAIMNENNFCSPKYFLQ